MLPKISIITPSYNQGQFLEQTILSVLGQSYPNLEYIILDGGSTDDSVEIIKKYDKHLSHWESNADGGQANAINKGFGMATGDILGWLNSDDMYLPGALFAAAKALDNGVNNRIIFGNCLHFEQENPRNVRGSNVVLDHKVLELRLADYVIQPSSFWTKKTFENVGPLDTSLNYTFDWDWFIRAQQKAVEFLPIPAFLSIYRLHSAHKTGTGGDIRLAEIDAVYGRYNTFQELRALKKIRKLKMIENNNKLIKRFFPKKRLLYFLFFPKLNSFKQFISIYRS